MSDDWVLVTGASRGIGRATAIAVAQLGFGVVLWARTATDISETLGQVTRCGGRGRTAIVDVSDPAAVTRAAADMADLGRLRAVVLNAGHGTWRSLLETTPDQWRDTVGVNLDGAFYVLRATLPLLLRHPDGQVLAVASDSAVYPFGRRAPYCAAKSGLRALAETARRETRERGIRVTVLMPSRVDTHFGGKRPGERADGLTADDVAAVIAFILSLPRHVEIRELQLAATSAPYGPFPEKLG
jgi:NADP-dependent 3-hydroxy acid dehydrogenase YdfG